MIPASFPLILVAAVCLAIGLIRGSSSLLIASIVASLLAAVALVIGLRHNATTRRATGPDPTGSPDDAVPAGPPPRRTAAPDAHDSAPAGAAFAADSGYPGDTPRAAGGPFAAEPPGPAGPAEFSAAGRAESSAAGRAESSAAGRAESSAAGSSPAESSAGAGRTDPIGFPAADADPVYADRPSADQGDTVDLPRATDSPSGAPAAGTHLPDETPAAADYHAASSTIGAARGSDADDQSWRRPPATPEPPVANEAPGVAERSFPAQASGPADPGPDPAALGDEFGEPDADDPDDEPLPQSVRPTDAVQVARLDTDVLVVDGRPRYHMADCPHLVGRLTEPLPAAEAVELGFSPCGLCRPVDRLLGANAHR